MFFKYIHCILLDSEDMEKALNKIFLNFGGEILGISYI